MDTQKRINRQRVHHIVDSYRLDGDDGDVFGEDLALLLEAYPQSLIELALTESIVKGWSEVPMQKGIPFMQKVYERLRSWQPDTLILGQSVSLLSFHQSSPCGQAALEVQMAQPSRSMMSSETIDTFLTPAQFEQITGLDSSLVFDEHGHIRLGYPVESQKPLEPRS